MGHKILQRTGQGSHFLPPDNYGWDNGSRLFNFTLMHRGEGNRVAHRHLDIPIPEHAPEAALPYQRLLERVLYFEGFTITVNRIKLAVLGIVTNSSPFDFNHQHAVLVVIEYKVDFVIFEATVSIDR